MIWLQEQEEKDRLAKISEEINRRRDEELRLTEDLCINEKEKKTKKKKVLIPSKVPTFSEGPRKLVHPYLLQYLRRPKLSEGPMKKVPVKQQRLPKGKMSESGESAQQGGPLWLTKDIPKFKGEKPESPFIHL